MLREPLTSHGIILQAGGFFFVGPLLSCSSFSEFSATNAVCKLALGMGCDNPWQPGQPPADPFLSKTFFSCSANKHLYSTAVTFSTTRKFEKDIWKSCCFDHFPFFWGGEKSRNCQNLVVSYLISMYSCVFSCFCFGNRWHLSSQQAIWWSSFFHLSCVRLCCLMSVLVLPSKSKDSVKCLF